MKIAVAGMGYVGLSLAVLLAQHCDVVAVDVLPEKSTRAVRPFRIGKSRNCSPPASCVCALRWMRAQLIARRILW